MTKNAGNCGLCGMHRKLLRSYDLEDRKHESARATHVKLNQLFLFTG